MRQSHERLLTAMGIAVGRSMSTRALIVFLAKDVAINSLLVLRGKVLGPSWPAIAEQLEQAGIEHSLVEAGKTWLVIADSPSNRETLQEMATRARECIQEQVLVADVGFVTAGKNKRFEPRVLIGPALVALMSLAFALVPAASPKSNEQMAVQTQEATCALDLPDGELESFIASSIDLSSSSTPGEVIVDSKLGLLSLEIQQTIGSTQSVTGSIQCEDGREKSLHYRLDVSANGMLVELSQRLDP
jgi:hypothetical protein